jgi:predicted flavoprotein YhiN
VKRKKTVGRKFLFAGKEGLNLTYNSSTEELIDPYSPVSFMAPILREFTNQDLINWLQRHEIQTFTGSSNRVFPDIEMKPIEVLKRITDFIATKAIEINRDTSWLRWDKEGQEP